MCSVFLATKVLLTGTPVNQGEAVQTEYLTWTEQATSQTTGAMMKSKVGVGSCVVGDTFYNDTLARDIISVEVTKLFRD